MGLNLKFDQVRIQILGKYDISCLKEVVAIIRCKESRKGIMLHSSITNEATMVIRDNNKPLMRTKMHSLIVDGQVKWWHKTMRIYGAHAKLNFDYGFGSNWPHDLFIIIYAYKENRKIATVDSFLITITRIWNVKSSHSHVLKYALHVPHYPQT